MYSHLKDLIFEMEDIVIIIISYRKYNKHAYVYPGGPSKTKDVCSPLQQYIFMFYFLTNMYFPIKQRFVLSNHTQTFLVVLLAVVSTQLMDL